MKKRRYLPENSRYLLSVNLKTKKAQHRYARNIVFIHQCRLTWKQGYKENPNMAFGGNGNICKLNAKVAEYGRIIGRQCTEINFFKKNINPIRNQTNGVSKMHMMELTCTSKLTCTSSMHKYQRETGKQKPF